MSRKVKISLEFKLAIRSFEQDISRSSDKVNDSKSLVAIGYAGALLTLQYI